MSLLGDIIMPTSLDESERIWKALSDTTRRVMLDALSDGPMKTGDLVDAFPDVCRTNVMKHLGVLVDAGLVIVKREGRVRWNYLNPVPIEAVCDRWVRRHVRRMAKSMLRLRDLAES